MIEIVKQLTTETLTDLAFARRLVGKNDFGGLLYVVGVKDKDHLGAIITSPRGCYLNPNGSYCLVTLRCFDWARRKEVDPPDASVHVQGYIDTFFAILSKRFGGQCLILQ